MYTIVLEQDDTLTLIGRATGKEQADALLKDAYKERGTEGAVALYQKVRHFDRITTRGVTP